MITKLTHVGIHVLDQDSAQDFYVNKLGFKVVTDVPMGKDTRWLTVAPPEQPDFEIVLTPIVESKQFPRETIEVMKDLVRRGTFGFGVFTCHDIYATYEEMKAKGVEFIKAPKKEFYGLEALFKDDSGNWASLAQLEP